LGRRIAHETRAKISQAMTARYRWDDDKKARITAMVRAGVSLRTICAREHLDRGTLGRFCDENNLPRVKRQNYNEASSQVLRDHYATNPDKLELLRLYSAARGAPMSDGAMQTHAHALGLKRPRSFGDPKPAPRSRADVAAETAAVNEAERRELAPKMQALMDGGMSSTEAARKLSISVKRMQRMLKDGLIVRPARQPAPPKPKVAKPRRQVRPATWVRVDAPAKPRPTYESVEAWLSAGNRITHCPAAVAEPTTYTPRPEDAAAIRAYYALQEAAAEAATTKERAKKTLGRIHFGVGA